MRGGNLLAGRLQRVLPRSSTLHGVGTRLGTRIMLKFLWKLTSPDERSENTLGMVAAVFSLIALGWLVLA